MGRNKDIRKAHAFGICSAVCIGGLLPDVVHLAGLSDELEMAFIRILLCSSCLCALIALDIGLGGGGAVE